MNIKEELEEEKEKKEQDIAFNRLKYLQLLIKMESYQNNKCKYILIIYIFSY